MIRQVILLLSAVTLSLALGDGRAFQSKKNVFQKQSQFASVASYHAAKPAQTPTHHDVAPANSFEPQVQPAAPSPYSFGYEADGSSRQESADASGKVTGSYKVINEDGTVRVVNYVADENGFRAEVDTNEAGTKSSNPSNVAVKSAFVEPAAPALPPAPKKYSASNEFGRTKASPVKIEQKQAQLNAGSNGAYSYNYEAQLEDGGSSAHSESSDGSGSVSGQYSLSVADGRRRKVDYKSGAQGFQAKVDTNEFGTKSDSPAHVQFYSSAPAQQEAAPSPYAQTGFIQQQQVSSYAAAPMRPEPVRAAKPAMFSQQPIQQQGFNEINAKPSPYAFSYDAQLEDGSSSRTESSDGSGKVVGSYSLATADGRQRTISYEADHEGFRAKVNTNEFGTKSDSPADAHFESSAPVVAPAAPQAIKSASHGHSSGQIKSAFQPQTAASGAQTYSYQAQQSVSQYDSGAESYAPYAFNYLAELDDGSSSRSESADGSGKVVGSYSLSVNDGRRRTVDYLADQAGFRASVNTNEFGTKSDSPADVQFYSSAVQDEAPAPQQYSSGFASQSAGSSGYGTKSSGFASQVAGTSGHASKTSAFASKTGSQSAGAGLKSVGAAASHNFAQQKMDAEPVYQPSPYAFNYEAEATGGSSARKEASDASGKVTGSYTVRNEDGSVRVVEYVADHNGFRANVKTNEPGTKSDNPADVMIKSDAPEAPISQPIQQQQQQHDFRAAQYSQPIQQTHQQPSFPARTNTPKSSMLSQQNVEPWRR